MQYQPPLNPPDGTLRVIKKFLWLPRKIDYSYVSLDHPYRGRFINGYDWRWLGQVYILQRFGVGLVSSDELPIWYDLVFFLPFPKMDSPPFIQLSPQGQAYLSTRQELTNFLKSQL